MNGAVGGQQLWANGMQGVQTGGDDFADFLDLGEFGMDFGAFDMDEQSTQQPGGQPHSQQDITMSDFANLPQNFSDGSATSQQHMHQHLQVQNRNIGLATVFEHPHAQQGIYGRSIVPPTPSSMELHPGAHNMANFLDQQGNLYQNMGTDPLVFTPLVSPAVTPLDTSFRIPEYSVSGAYFSPLTSPALDAQALGYIQQRKLPKSPVEPTESSNLNPKKSTGRRKSVTGRNPARVVRQSPSMKPQPGRRKPGPTVPSLELTDAALAGVVAESPRTPASRRSGSLRIPSEYLPSSRDSSSADSISPEPLSESLMPPPPPPGSSHGRSPMIPPQRNQEVILPSPMQAPPPPAPEVNEEESQPTKKDKGGKPATPASLMNLPKGLAVKRGVTAGDLLQTATVIPPVGEEKSGSGTSTPLDEQVTPKLSAMHRSSANVTPSSSPMIEAKPAGSDSRPPSGSLKARPDGRGHSKRGSISASPALQPRISPSIKPLLPEGLSASQSALILASKSNYEHIVSGNHSQLGLSYPEHLATNLTHKRTSHKIAEQGRRNRINSALSEIAALLPQKPVEGSGGSGQPGSKASTVELAIEYIKELQENLEKTTSRLATVEAELNALKLEKGILVSMPSASGSAEKEMTDANDPSVPPDGLDDNKTPTGKEALSLP